MYTSLAHEHDWKLWKGGLYIRYNKTKSKNIIISKHACICEYVSGNMHEGRLIIYEAGSNVLPLIFLVGTLYSDMFISNTHRLIIYSCHMSVKTVNSKNC